MSWSKVASPSTRRYDDSIKANDYFTLASVRHYLIVDPDGPAVVHRRRQEGSILKSTVHDGRLSLSLPGLDLTVAELFA